MEKVERTKKRKIIYITIVSVFLVFSIFLSFFRFSMVWTRILQSGKDFGLSVAYYTMTIVGNYDSIVPTVSEIPDGIETILPIDWEDFKVLCQIFGQKLIDKNNLSEFFVIVGDVLYNVFQFCVFFSIPVILVVLSVKIMRKKSDSDDLEEEKAKSEPQENLDNVDTKSLVFYKKLESKILAPTLRAIQDFFGWWNKSGIFRFLTIVIWSYNLNVLTILLEFLGYFFYFACSTDFVHIYTLFVKFFFDISVSVDFLPLIAWLAIFYLIIDVIRKKIALKRLEKGEEKLEQFLNDYPGALFFVGPQRSRKTTNLVNIGITQASSMRKVAKEKIQANDKFFAFFPWINLERSFETAFKMKKLPTLASCRNYIRKLCGFFENRDKMTEAEITRELGFLKKDYGYAFDDFIFAYDYNRYGLEVNDGLRIRPIFEIIELYIQEYYIYTAPTSLIFANFSVRDTIRWKDEGNFPLYDEKLFDFDIKKRDDLSVFCHILDQDSIRLGTVEDTKGLYKDGLEIAVALIMEIGKERGNQFSNAGLDRTSETCNQKNDGFEDDIKMRGHCATIDNYTFFRELMDDQRAGSLGANNSDLTTIIQIKEAKPFKNLLLFFLLEDLIYKILTKIYDKIHEDERYYHADNTLWGYLAKRIYGPYHIFYTRYVNRYSQATTVVQITDGMSRESQGEEKLPLSMFKVYSGTYETAGIQSFYHNKNQKSEYGLNDFPVYKDIKMTWDEMKMQHSHFFNQIGRTFDLSDIDNDEF